MSTEMYLTLVQANKEIERLREEVEALKKEIAKLKADKEDEVRL
jgi:cell division protein FtsB